MSNYVSQEVDKILNNQEKYPEPLNQAMSCAWILGNLKGVNLSIFDLEGKSSLSDYTVLACATNPRQAQAMSQEIINQMKRVGRRVYSVEGTNESDWTLVDLGDVIIHIILETAQYNYNLEELWTECPKVEIPTEYYYTSDSAGSEESGEEYF